MRIRNLLFFSLSCFMSIVHANTLNDVLNETVSTHPEIAQLESEQAAVRQTIKQAKGEYLPSVDIEAGIGEEYSDNPATRAATNGSTNFTRSEGTLRLRQLLFDGGDVIHTVHSRKFDFNRAHELVREAKNDLMLQAASAYIDVLRRKDLVKIREKSIEAHHEIMKKVKERFDAGAGRKSEVALVVARTALAQGQLDEQVGLRHNARDTFQSVVGREPQVSDMTLPSLPSKLPHSSEEAIAIGLQNNPTLAAVTEQLYANVETTKASKAAFYPNFYIDLEYGNNNNLDGVKGSNVEALAMLRMEYNIYRGGIDIATVREAAERTMATQHDSDRIKRAVVEEVEVSWNDYQTAQTRSPSLKKHRDEALQVYNDYVEQFSLGQRTLFDLLNAQVEYFNASAAYTDNLYNIHRNAYRLLSTMGVITSLV